jgi:hypothetical protein
VKEYQALFAAWVGFRGRIKTVNAVEVEKVAFVIGHWELLGGEEREMVLAFGQEGGEKAEKNIVEHREEDFGEKSGKADESEGAGAAAMSGELAQSTDAVKAARKRTAVLQGEGKKVVKEKRQLVDDDPSVRRSKRVKK